MLPYDTCTMPKERQHNVRVGQSTRRVKHNDIRILLHERLFGLPTIQSLSSSAFEMKRQQKPRTTRPRRIREGHQLHEKPAMTAYIL